MSAHRPTKLMLAAASVALLWTGAVNADVSHQTSRLILTRLELQLGSGSTVAVRAGAARTLGKMGPSARRCLPALGRALHSDRAPQVRLAAATALGQLRHRRALGALQKALQEDRQPAVRHGALEALARFREPAATQAITRALARDPSRLVRERAARLLSQRKLTGRRHAEAARGLGDALVGDIDRGVRLAAAATLRQPALARASRDALREALVKDPSEEIAILASRALANAGASAELAMAARAEGPGQYWAVRGLGGMGAATRQPASIAALRAALNSPASRVRRAAAWALGRSRSGETSVTLALQQRLIHDGTADVRRQAATALGCVDGGARAVGALRLALERDPDPEVRQAVAWALGRVGSPAAVAALQPGLGDQVPAVRRTVAVALHR